MKENKTLPSKAGVWICPYCLAEFLTRWNMREHRRSAHQKEKP